MLFVGQLTPVQDPSTLMSLPIGTVQALTNPTAASTFPFYTFIQTPFSYIRMSDFLNLAIPAATLLGGLLGQLQDCA